MNQAQPTFITEPEFSLAEIINTRMQGYPNCSMIRATGYNGTVFDPNQRPATFIKDMEWEEMYYRLTRAGRTSSSPGGMHPLLVDDSITEAVAYDYEQYYTMCGGLVGFFLTEQLDDTCNLTAQGRQICVDASGTLNKVWSAELSPTAMFTHNSVGIVVIVVDTAAFNAPLIALMDKVFAHMETDSDVTCASSEYHSIEHEGQTAKIYVGHHMNIAAHDEWDGGRGSCPNCGDDTLTDEYLMEEGDYFCRFCEESFPSEEVLYADDEDIHYFMHKGQDVRTAWMSTRIPPSEHAWGRVGCEGSPNAKHMFTTATYFIEWGSYVGYRTIDDDDVAFDAIVSYLSDPSGRPYVEHPDKLCIVDGRLIVPVGISSQVGQSAEHSLTPDVMRVLIAKQDRLKEIGAKLVIPERGACNPKEHYHFTDSLLLVPLMPADPHDIMGEEDKEDA